MRDDNPIIEMLEFQLQETRESRDRFRDENAKLREENAELRRDMDAKIDEWLARPHCCNGHECGCQGVTRLQWILAERQVT